MNIGVYVSSLEPPGASQAQLQTVLLGALKRHPQDRFRFLVLTKAVPAGYVDSNTMSYHALATGSRRRSFVQRAGAVLRAGVGLRGLTGRLVEPQPPEPAYYRQLHDLNVRLVWNLNQHALTTSLPYIRTVWEINHRIIPMFPEYSSTRLTFDRLDARMDYSLARASYVIAGTREGKRQLQDVYGAYADKIRVIPLPTPIFPDSVAAQAPPKDVPPGAPYVFYPARFWPHKNHYALLAALKILDEQHGIRLRCVLSGRDEGNLQYVLRCAADLGVRDRVIHVGSVEVEDMPSLYRNALALVFPSAVGPDNLPPLEAMSLGCPVITADVPGTREQCGNAALFFPPMDEGQLAARIVELIRTEGLRNQLIEAGRQRAASWTADDYIGSVLSILDEFALVARNWEHGNVTLT